jgi:hypothetical protein
VQLELWGADRKAQLLSKLIGLPVEVVGPAGVAVTSNAEAEGE